MPYKIDPNNKKCIIKADTGKKVGCTKGSVKRYLAALHANVNESDESLNKMDTFLDDKVLIFDPPIEKDDYLEKLAPILMSMNILWFDGQPIKKGGEIGKNIFYSNNDGYKYFLFDKKNPSKSYYTQRDWVMSAIPNDEQIQKYLFGWINRSSTIRQFNNSEKIDGWGFINNFKDIINFNPFDQLNESEEWYNEVLNKKPLIRFDDLMVGDVISNIDPEHGQPDTYFHVLSFEDGSTWRNAYQEPEKYMVCNLVEEDHDTGNFISVSRTDLKFPRGTNQPIWTLIYREGVTESINESEEGFEWAEDVISDSSIVANLLSYKGKEIVIDVESLNTDEMRRLYFILKPYVETDINDAIPTDDGGVVYWDNSCFWPNWGQNTGSKRFNAISLHCGIEDNDYKPVKGLICCLPTVEKALRTLDEGNYIQVNGKDLLSMVGENINESEGFEWVKNMDPLEFIRNTFKNGNVEYGQLVNGSYGLSVEVPEETNYSYDEEKSIQKELENRIGVHCYFSMARGGDDELLFSITVDSKEELEKVMDWIKYDNNLNESEELEWFDDLTKYLKVGQQFAIGKDRNLVQIVRIKTKPNNILLNTIYVSPIDMVNKNYPGVPINVQKLIKIIQNGSWIPVEKNINESEEDFSWVPQIEDNISVPFREIFNSDILSLGDVITLSGTIYEAGKPERVYVTFDNTPLRFADEVKYKDKKTLKFEWLIPLQSRPRGWNVVSKNGYFETDNTTIDTGDGDLIVSSIIKASDVVNESKDDFGWAEDLFKSVDEGVNITDKDELSELRPNTILSITGNQDFLELNESEDDLEWAEDIVSLPPLEFVGKEIMIDIQGLNTKELKKLYEIVSPYISKSDWFTTNEGEEIIWKDNDKCFKEMLTNGSGRNKSISLHCGLEDNDYLPLKGALCCLKGTYDDEPSYSKENIIPINAREIIGGTINESEEDSELFWAEDLLKGVEEYVDITDKLDIMEELPVGAILKVSGYQDEMEFYNEEVKLIDKAEGQNYQSTHYLFKLKKERFSDSSEATHCGQSKHHKICDCRPATEEDDIFESEVGKCWWINLKKQDKVIYYPNRLGINESEDEFDWVPSEVDLNNPEVLFTVIEDALKNSNFKIVLNGFRFKDGQTYSIEDEDWNSIGKKHTYIYVPENDFNLPFIYHNIRDNLFFLNRFRKIENNNDLIPYYKKLLKLIQPLYNRNKDILFKPINESEDDLEWAEDAISGLEHYEDYDGQDLPEGTFLIINGEWEGMYFDNTEAKVVRPSKYNSEQGLYLLVFSKNMEGEGGYTHCGGDPDDYEGDSHKCHCENDSNDRGRCWFTYLNKLDVKIFPNRKGFLNENKKPLLTEGRYDSITRKAVKDIMNVVIQTRGRNDELHQANLPNDMRETEFEYSQEGLSFSIELNVHHQSIYGTRQADKEENAYYVHTAIADDDENVIMMTIAVDPLWEPRIYEKLFYKLQEDIRHEIEHFTQMGPNRIPDRPISRTNTANLKTVYGHHKNKIEVPALVHGFYRRAKLEKRPLDEVMVEDLDSEIAKGNLDKKQAEKLLKVWIDYAKKNLPKAKYSA